jgi:Invasion associated locus B (IalB) protein
LAADIQVMNNFFRRFSAGVLLGSGWLLTTGLAVHAEEPAAAPTSLGKFEAWEAFTYQAEDSKVCYVFSAPAKSEVNKKVNRDPAYFMITHWPGRKVKGQVSTIIGYKFKEGSGVKLELGDKSFDLYPVDNMAWTDKAETEKAIIAAMKGGKSMKVSGTSQRDTETKDTYTLAGLKAALAKIDSVCK